jgi:NAD(P)-dependent dehydrogenase (short-subunit alcohol dehydrogenase family)
MIAQGSGLIVHISAMAAGQIGAGVAYSVAKAATNRMAATMAHELAAHGVAVVALYPGLVRTEGVLAHAKFFDLSNSESPQFSGRAIAALAGDPAVMAKSGQVCVVAALALEYGFTDIDGKQPRPLTPESS